MNNFDSFRDVDFKPDTKFIVKEELTKKERDLYLMVSLEKIVQVIEGALIEDDKPTAITFGFTYLNKTGEEESIILIVGEPNKTKGLLIQMGEYLHGRQ